MVVVGEVGVEVTVGEGVVERRMVIMVVVVLLPRDAASAAGEEEAVDYQLRAWDLTSHVVALGQALVRPRCHPKRDLTAVQYRRFGLHSWQMQCNLGVCGMLAAIPHPRQRDAPRALSLGEGRAHRAMSPQTV